jgi:uncharacterized protein with von Willebrand factor type A (vWA) domain
MAGLVRQRTFVAALIDESGSMAGVKRDVVEGYNGYLKMLRETPAEIRASLTLFDTEVHEVYAGVPVMRAEGLAKVYDPEMGGNTALYDAVGITVHRLDQIAQDHDRVLVIIMTDGADNASVEMTLAKVRTLITAREATGKWSFIFLGADLMTGRKMGITSVLQLTATGEGVRKALAEVTERAHRFLLTDGGDSPVYTG